MGLTDDGSYASDEVKKTSFVRWMRLPLSEVFMEMATVEESLSASENNFGRVGVVFSSGFFGFFAHAGFLAAFREMRIVPAAFAGASSGAIVAAMAAAEMGNDDIRELLFNLNKDDFWDPDPLPRFLKSALRLFRGYTGYLRGDGFTRLLKRLPTSYFEKCRYPLAISAVDVTHRREKIFTSGNLVKAVQASGSVPMLFQAVEIDGGFYVDGGLSSKAPVEALADLCGLDKILIHFVASDNVKKTGNGFMKKRFTPWRMQHIAINTARMEDYERQKRIVAMRGVKVIEINTGAPSVGPNSLDRGPATYRAAKASALRYLEKMF
ncbi:MAG: patatin-like phospholipase family protein [Deltaproteobacteria bacterium]|nr:patatin-like phospholipase family protein [Deltaproteobacteria bacterium]